MPTAAKLFAAIGFALAAFLASEIYKPLLPEGSQVGMLAQVNAAVGLVCGWLIAGRLVGKGYSAAASAGIRTAGVILFYVLLLWSAREMLERSVHLHYDGPTDALAAMMELVAEYFVLMLSGPQVPIMLFGGGVMAAWLAEWAAEQWS